MTGAVNLYGARTLVETVRAGVLTVYRVEVWGEPPNDYARVYTLSSRTPEDAAAEGLERFTQEVSALLGVEPSANLAP